MILPLAGLLTICYMVVNRSAWVQHRSQEMVARYLADLTGREVRVGPLTGNLLTGVQVDGLAVAAGENFSEGALVTARRLRVSYDLLAIVRRRSTPAAAVRQVRIEGLEVDLVRDADGRLNLQQLLPPPKAPVPPEDQFQGEVWLSDAHLHYTDHSNEFGPTPLHLELEDLSGHVDMRRVGLIRVDLSATGDSGDFSSLIAEGVVDTIHGGFSFDLQLADLDLAWAQHRLSPNSPVSVMNGRAQVEGALYRVPTENATDTGYSIKAKLDPTTVAVPSLPAGPVQMDGELIVTPQGVITDAMRLAWNGQSMLVTGSVVDFDQPSLDLELQASAVDVGRVLQALPAKTRSELPPFSVQGPVSVQARVIGPPQHAAIDLRLGTSGTVTSEPTEELSISADGLDLSVALVDLSEPVLVGRADMETVHPGPIPLAAPDDDSWPEHLTVSALHSVTAQLQWYAGMPEVSGSLVVENAHLAESDLMSAAPLDALTVEAAVIDGAPQAHSRLALDGVRLWDVELSDIRTEATLVGTALRLRDLQADVLDGRLAGEAVVDLSGDTPAIYADGTLRDVELSGLPIARLGFHAPPRGLLDADFVVSYHDGQLSSAASVRGNELAYQQYEASGAGALLTLEGERLEVPVAFAVSPMGTVWATGSLGSVQQPSDSELSADFQVAEAHLDSVLEQFDIEQAGGVLYIQGQVSGTPTNPSIHAEATVFEPRYQRYQLDALSAELTTDLQDVHVTQMLASRGSAAISASGSLEGLEDLRKSKQYADARIAGRFDGAGIQLADVVEMLGRDVDSLDGLAEIQGVFGGTLADPIATGQVQIAHAMTTSLDISEGRIPFELSGLVISVDDAVFQVQGSELHAQASVDLRDEPALTASLSAADIYLEGIYQLQDMGLDVGGLVQMPVAWVVGPLDNLSGQARLVSDRIVIGGQPVEGLQAELALSKQLVKLLGMQCQLADGEVGAVGEYDIDTRQMYADAILTGTSVSRLLNLARPVAAAVNSEQDAERRESLLRTVDAMSLRLDGRLSGEIHIEGGADNPVGRAQVQLHDAVFDRVPLPDVRTTATGDREGLYDIAMEATQGDALITAEGDLRYDGEMNVLVVGSGMDMARYDRWTPFRSAMGGELGFTVMAGGSTRKPQIMASVDVLNPQLAGVSFDVLSAPIISIEEGTLAVDTLTLRRSYERQEASEPQETSDSQQTLAGGHQLSSSRTGEEMVIDGTLPFSWEPVGIVADQPMKLEARIEDTEVALFPVLMDEFAQYEARRDGVDASDIWTRLSLAGSVDSTLRMTGTPAKPELYGFLQVQDGSVAIGERTSMLKNIALDLELHGQEQGNSIFIKQADANWEDLKLGLAGNATITQTAPARMAENQYDLTLTLDADQQQLARGLTAWEVGGKATLKGGGLHAPELTIEQVGGKFGKGHFTVDGTAQMADFRFANLADNAMDITLVADRAEMALRGLVEGVLEGRVDVTGAGDGTPAQIAGAYTLSHGRLGLPAGGGGQGELHAPGSSYPKPRLDVRLALGPDMQLVGPGIVAPIQPTARAAHVQGTLQMPVIEGVVEAQRGRTQVSGGMATIKTMRAQYRLARKPEAIRRDPVSLELTGNILGEAETAVRSAVVYGRDIGTVMIDMKLSGNLPDQLRVDVSSHPPLQEAQIYALLGSQPFSYFTGEGAGGALELENIVSEQFLGALAAGFRVAIFEPLEQELRRLLGLSEFSLHFAFNQPVELQLGKYLLEDLLVTYHTTIGTGGDRYDLTVAYEVGRDWRVSYNTDETNRNRVQLERVWSF